MIKTIVLAMTFVACVAQAQSYPAKSIRLIIPYPPGGATDILGRTVVQKLGDVFHQQVIADNRSGATGVLGLELAAKAPPDGHTIVIGQTSNMAINAALMNKLPYDPVKDFAPITLLASTPNILVVHPSLPVRSVNDLVKLARGKPGQINYASSGNGSPGHLTAEMFKKAAHIDMVHIPYRGAAPALVDVVAGQADLYFTSPISAQTFVQSGRLRVIAVASAQRVQSMPNVPSMAEAGYPQVDSGSWWGLLAPAGVSREIIEKLNSETVRILGLPDVKERLMAQGADPAPSTTAQFGAYIKAEIVKWASIVRTTGAKLE